MRTLRNRAIASLLLAGTALILDMPSALAQHPAGQHGHRAMAGEGTGQELHRSMAAGMDKMMSMQSTGDIDRDFATMMKMHHQMAIDMSTAEIEKGKSADMKKLAEGVIKDSQRDIKRIDQWLEQKK